MKKIWCLFALMMIFGCSNDAITTNAIAEVSTLTVRVLDENNSLIGGVNVFLNEELKGSTSKYGDSKGTQELVLDGNYNWIKVQKEGYSQVEPKLVSSALNKQAVTFQLAERKSQVNIEVEDLAGMNLPGVRLGFFSENKAMAEQVIITDKYGEATIGGLTDGEYLIKFRKPGYAPEDQKLQVRDSFHGVTVDLSIKLTPLPRFEVEIVDSQGKDLDLVEIRLFSQEAYNSPGGMPDIVQFSDAKGIATFTDIRANGTYQITLKKAGYAAQVHELTGDYDSQLLHVAMQEE